MTSSLLTTVCLQMLLTQSKDRDEPRALPETAMLPPSAFTTCTSVSSQMRLQQIWTARSGEDKRPLEEAAKLWREWSLAETPEEARHAVACNETSCKVAARVTANCQPNLLPTILEAIMRGLPSLHLSKHPEPAPLGVGKTSNHFIHLNVAPLSTRGRRQLPLPVDGGECVGEAQRETGAVTSAPHRLKPLQ